MNDYEALTLIM